MKRTGCAMRSPGVCGQVGVLLMPFPHEVPATRAFAKQLMKGTGQHLKTPTSAATPLKSKFLSLNVVKWFFTIPRRADHYLEAL